MSSVSNKIYVQAIDDGSTLHGQLLSTRPLSQAWSGSTAIPNWTVAANQPIIYVDLVNGAEKVTANVGGTWTYNGSPVSNYPSLFEVTTKDGAPALKIKGNLANSENRDTDIIGYSGSYTVGGNDVTFALSTTVRITGVTATGIFGQIVFSDGSNIITEKDQDLEVYAVLYDSNGTEMETSKYECNFYVNEGSALVKHTKTIGGKSYYATYINEGEVTDNAIVRCFFRETTNMQTFNAYESVDDQTDPEQMYIQTVVTAVGGDTSGESTPDGGGMELHNGQQVQFRVWMGTMTDSTPDTSWTDFRIRLHKSDGGLVESSISGLPNVISGSGGYRQMTYDTTKNYATIIFTYNVVKNNFDKYLTGYIMATK